jgi:hypothetical protein
VDQEVAVVAEASYQIILRVLQVQQTPAAEVAEVVLMAQQ